MPTPPTTRTPHMQDSSEELVPSPMFQCLSYSAPVVTIRQPELMHQDPGSSDTPSTRHLCIEVLRH
jgi:hypothetical protein